MSTTLTYNYPYYTTRPLSTPRPSDYDVPEHMRAQYENMTLFILKWMTMRRFFSEVSISDFGEIRAVISEDARTGTCPFSIILKTNLRTLADPATLTQFLERIQDTTEQTGVTDYINLISTIAATYPETLVNQVVNKVYRAVTSISYGVPDEVWVEIHSTHPYLWMVMYMNILANRYSDPRLVM